MGQKNISYSKLYLPLKKRWFELTKDGVKREDYREINEYWAKRLLIFSKKDDTYDLLDIIHLLNGSKDKEEIEDILYSCCGGISFRKYIYNVMTLGYPKKCDKERILIYEHAGIEIRCGNPEWGALPKKNYFVIKHGKLINDIDANSC